MSRRDFIKKGLALLVGSQLLRGSTQQRNWTVNDQLGSVTEKALAPQGKVDHLIIDYTTDSELTTGLIETHTKGMVGQVATLIESLKGVPTPKSRGNDLVGALVQLQDLTKNQTVTPDQVDTLMNLGRPVVKAVIDEVLKVAGQHGDFVRSVYLRRLDEVSASKKSSQGLEIVPLQGFVSDISLTLDPTGLICADLNFDASRLITIFDAVYANNPAQKDVTLIIGGAFNFGKIHATMPLYEVREFDETVDENGFIPYPQNFPQIYDMAQQQAAAHSGSVVETISMVYPRTQEVELTFKYADGFEDRRRFPALQIAASSHAVTSEEKKQAAQDLIQQTLVDYLGRIPPSNRLDTFKRLKDAHLINAVFNYEEKQSYTEPYGSTDVQTNFKGFTDFCRRFSNIFMVHAGGNNADIRTVSDRPENGIVTSSVNSAGRRKFGRDGNVGCLGADIYLLDKDFVPKDPERTIFSTSETVGIVSAYGEAFAEKGLTPFEIKQVLIELCSEQADISHNFSINLENVPILKPEKVQSALKKDARMLRRELGNVILVGSSEAA